MKKQDLIQIVSKLAASEFVSINIDSTPKISFEGTARMALLFLDWIKIDAEWDIFYMAAKNFNTEPIKSDRPTISYFCLVNMQPNARALKQLTDWQTWLKDLKNNPNATDIRLNFDPNAEFIPIF